jgi:hypothetical protein
MSKQRHVAGYLAKRCRDCDETHPLHRVELDLIAELLDPPPKQRGKRKASPDTVERQKLIAREARLLIDKGLTVDEMHDEIKKRWGVGPRYIDYARAEVTEPARESRLLDLVAEYYRKKSSARTS